MFTLWLLMSEIKDKDMVVEVAPAAKKKRGLKPTNKNHESVVEDDFESWRWSSRNHNKVNPSHVRLTHIKNLINKVKINPNMKLSLKGNLLLLPLLKRTLHPSNVSSRPKCATRHQVDNGSGNMVYNQSCAISVKGTTKELLFIMAVGMSDRGSQSDTRADIKETDIKQKESQKHQSQARNGKDKVKSRPKSVKVKKSTGKSTPSKSKDSQVEKIQLEGLKLPNLKLYYENKRQGLKLHTG
ncbi:hypothetical protein Tco_1071012 [Tanacetum coccineum]|uniref:Uncharacterized protein n=1 Tax=Tanacetum coccineum TaxID=301880 RepID=A0ABQ5HPU8_9ASTR